MQTQMILRIVLNNDETLQFAGSLADRNEIILDAEHLAREYNAPAHIFSSGGKLLMSMANPNNRSEYVR